jgi:O-6-methylguanine DNA methyltransferase
MHHRIKYSIHTISQIKFIIASELESIVYLGWNKERFTKKFKTAVCEETQLHTFVANELKEYFKGKVHNFSFKTKLYGTEFQVKVWEKLLQIPYGELKNYGDIAKLIERPKAQRAVGGALNKNPIAIIYPCHRVVGKNGKLTGYAGGTHLKNKLIALESTR